MRSRNENVAHAAAPKLLRKSRFRQGCGLLCRKHCSASLAVHDNEDGRSIPLRLTLQNFWDESRRRRHDAVVVDDVVVATEKGFVERPDIMVVFQTAVDAR
jgi:thiamine phosphate synthase YjbQ (UPF0047 family)